MAVLVIVNNISSDILHQATIALRNVLCAIQQTEFSVIKYGVLCLFTGT